MKRPLRVRIRLWVLMSVSFSMIMMLTVAAVIHTFIGHMGDEYRKEMSRMLSNGLTQLEASDFSESTLKTLSKQGVSILLMDAGTGELRFRSGGLLPMAEDVQLDVSALKHSGESDEEYLYLNALVQNRVGDGDGSFMATDIDLTNQPGGDSLECKELFLCGREGDRLFCLNLPLESTNTAVKLGIRFTRRVGLVVRLLSIVMFYFMSKLICRPHRRIAQTAAQIAKLDFSQRCPESVTWELDDLRRSINTMADSLEVHVNALRETNDRLQTELAERIRQQQISSELIGNLAHDLKTPIAIISGYAEGLVEGVARSPEKQQTYYETILRESERMQTTVTRILALGRMESGETPIKMEHFDLVKMLEEILSGFQRELERRDLRLTRVGFAPCPVYTDYECARQSLINYVQNAVYHINGGNRIEIRLEDRGDRVRVKVLNSSAPIPEAEARKLWDKLYRGDPSRQRNNGEMGLGLSIVKGNMERLGHAYGFENDPDFPGACFWLELPVGDGEQGTGNRERRNGFFASLRMTA